MPTIGRLDPARNTHTVITLYCCSSSSAFNCSITCDIIIQSLCVQLTISYIETVSLTEDRQKQLEDQYHFTCRCQRCDSQHMVRDMITVTHKQPPNPQSPCRLPSDATVNLIVSRSLQCQKFGTAKKKFEIFCPNLFLTLIS